MDRLAAAGAAAPRPIAVKRELGTPQLGAAWALPVGLELRANWTDAARAPEFLELFGDQAAVAANPALRPERVTSRDLGLAWQGARDGWLGAVEVARFRSDARDLIQWWRNAPNTVRADNLLTATTRGAELSAHVEAPAGLVLAGALTWASSRNTSPRPLAWSGRRLPLRPDRLAWLGLTWRHGPWHAVLDVQHRGESWLDPANRLRVPPRTLAGATLARTIAGTMLRAVIEGRNLGNVRAYDAGGFPLPGRSVMVGCELARAGGGR